MVCVEVGIVETKYLDKCVGYAIEKGPDLADALLAGKELRDIKTALAKKDVDNAGLFEALDRIVDKLIHPTEPVSGLDAAMGIEALAKARGE